ncbi:MAG: DUF167 domain-containing protein [Proteobacteria bacterium]|nr:DUF167 domain-containing protein [Pseudomonadota bacterium]
MLQVHVQPGASRTEVAGLHGDCLKIRLSARAVEGEANACLVEFIAAALGVAKRAVSIDSGASSRRKRVAVQSPARGPEALWKS